MAGIALAVVGVLGVALDTAIKTYKFVSSIVDAPRAIRNLASHINTSRLFLEPLLDLISKPFIQERAQNIAFLPSVEHAIAGFQVTLSEIGTELRRYVKYVAGSETPTWAGWASRRRFRYALNKSTLEKLEFSLLGRMQSLHMALRPMDLSWTQSLAKEDRTAIETVRKKASTLSVTSGSSCCRYQNNYPGSFYQQIDLDEGATDLDDEMNPWKPQATFRSGKLSTTGRATIDTSCDLNIVSEQIVKKLQAPINRLTSLPVDIRVVGGSIWTLGTVKLGLRLGSSDSNYTTVRAHVVPEEANSFDILLGRPWVVKTQHFLDAAVGARVNVHDWLLLNKPACSVVNRRNIETGDSVIRVRAAVDSL